MTALFTTYIYLNMNVCTRISKFTSSHNPRGVATRTERGEGSRVKDVSLLHLKLHVENPFHILFFNMLSIMYRCV